MARGKKPYPAQIMDLEKKRMRLTKEDLKSRIENEPTINSAELRCPERLSADAKIEWERIVNLYADFNPPIITDLDINALEIYCEATVRYRKAMDKINETSEIITLKGEVKQNPYLRIANDTAILMKKYSEVLLLDPVSRAKIGYEKSKQKQDENSYLFGD